METKTIYSLMREGDPGKVGATYLIDHYKRGRLGIMEPSGEAARAAWNAKKAPPQKASQTLITEGRTNDRVPKRTESRR